MHTFYKFAHRMYTFYDFLHSIQHMHYIVTCGLHCWIHVADTDECVNVTCQNDGVCWDRINDYECNCTQYWRGDHCETGQYTILNGRSF